ncbi:MAG: hypothetical protein OXD01_08315 [Gammaproteobacteria bacterium]|nr:hypothetical protein [Gammaproteobacteria bacterium]
MSKSTLSRFSSYALFLLTIAGCAREPDVVDQQVADLATAENMIDAFYSFDPARLQPLLSEAGEAEVAILGYQAWAEGGNYMVLERTPCAIESKGTVVCAITVQDDPVLALETGFNVTDTFHISFVEGVIVGVETSSNDQPIYYEARQWVVQNLPEVMEGPCRETEGVRESPGDCAIAMTRGYRQFMQARTTETKGISPFIPEDFEPPTLVETTDFVVVPLGPDLVDIDYAAYMSSIEHLQQTFTRGTSWPHENITAEEAMQDMVAEQNRFNNRESFAYAVLTPDGERERGCIYVRSVSKPGFDAEVVLWVTAEEYEAGFDPTLYAWTMEWIEENWPFDAVAYPGRSIEWDDWDAL